MKLFAGLAKRSILILAIQPIAVLLLSLAARAERGPFWQMRVLDPDYVYLLSALRVARLTPPMHNDHPGLTVQVPGGILLRAVEVVDRMRGLPRTSLVDAVLRDPERYLRILSNAMLILSSLSLFLAGVAAMRLGLSLSSALTLQASWMLTPIILSKGTRVAPEAVFPALLPWAGLLLVWYGQRPHVVWSAKHSLVTGLLLALLLATKLTALPWLALILLPGNQKAAAQIVATMVAALALFLLPIYSRIGSVAEWVFNLITHKGVYGEGSRGLIDLRAAGIALKGLMMGDPALFAITAAAAAVIVRHLSIARHASAKDLEAADLSRRRMRALSVAMLVMLGTIVLTAKHPGQHYLLPAAGTLGAMLVLLFASPRAPDDRLAMPRSALGLGATLAVVTGVLCFSGVRRDREMRINTARLVGAVAIIDRACSRVYYYSASSPEYALSFGNAWGGFSKDIAIVRHGNYWVYDRGQLTSHGNPLPIDTIRHVPCLVVQGAARDNSGSLDTLAWAAGRMPANAQRLFTDSNTAGRESPVPRYEMLPQSWKQEMAWLVRPSAAPPTPHN